MPAFTPFTRFLTLDGLGVTFNAVGNYAAAAQTVQLSPASDEVMLCTRLLFYARSSGGSFSAYNSLAALAQGWAIEAQSQAWGGAVRNLSGGDGLLLAADGNVHRDAHIDRIAYDVAQKSFGSGAGTSLVTAARFSFDKFSADTRKSWGESRGGILLYPGDFIRVVLNDDFTGLIEQSWCIEGTLVESTGQVLI